MNNIRLAVGLPNTGTIKSQTVFALDRMLKSFPHPYQLILQNSCAIHHNRTEIVRIAQKLECTHLLFVDSDMFFEKDALNQLLARDVDIVGVNYNQRKLPLTSTVLMDEKVRKNLKKTNPDGFVECIGVGTGFMLIKLEVFGKLEEPWFFWKPTGEFESEDYWFCRIARESGLKVHVDLGIPVKHIGVYFF
jgi:hypothetical protein